MQKIGGAIKSSQGDKRFDPERPRDATWNERYFHFLDPDGHELSFATPLK
jgi:hypothetical protein